MKQNYYVRKTDGTITIRVVCAVVFLFFSFSWLYWFQADILAVAQHGLSGGKTHYSRLWGALIITGVLFVLHLIVYAFTRLARRTHALTYLPSFLLLSFISSVSCPFHWGAWLWVAPLVLVLWVGCVILAKKVYPFSGDNNQPVGLFSRRMWLNMLQMVAMMLGVAVVSNTNAVSHFKAHAEIALTKGDIDEALRVGKRSLETDESLTMLRIFALAQQGQLGSRLFEYPVVGTSRDMLPLLGSKGQFSLLSDTLLWDFFGVLPEIIAFRTYNLGQPLALSGSMISIDQYLDSLEHDTLATAAFRDYRLTGRLIDRRLDSFVISLPRCYPLCADSLPRHYREALMLYQQRFDTTFVYSDSLMLLRWHEYARYDTLYSQRVERKLRSEDDFRGTYWYYFEN